MKLEGITINFLGDSITFGALLDNPEEEVFHAVMKKETGIKEIRNYGIPGTKFALQTATEEKPLDDYVDKNSFCERFDKMDDDADLVVVFGGTNDYGYGTALLGGFSDRTPETFYGACHYLFSGLVKKYLGKPIVVMTPLHRKGETLNSGTSKSQGVGTLKEYVNIIREVAEYYSLPVLDLFAKSGLQPEIDEVNEKYFYDGLHPNKEGHKILAQKVKSYLEAL